MRLRNPACVSTVSSRLFAITPLAAALLWLPGAASAQSLQELYDAARVFDATYLAAKANAASVEYRAGAERSAAAAFPGRHRRATATQTDPPNVGRLGTNTLSGRFDGRYPLFNRANGVTVEQARKSLITAQADLDTAEQDLIMRVAQAYFDVLAAQDTLTTTRANKTGITEVLASAKRNFEVGTATITDTREAQARFDLATAQELAAENDLRIKRLALDTLVGRAGVDAQAAAGAGGAARADPGQPRRMGDAGRPGPPRRAPRAHRPGSGAAGNQQGPRR